MEERASPGIPTSFGNTDVRTSYENADTMLSKMTAAAGISKLGEGFKQRRESAFYHAKNLFGIKTPKYTRSVMRGKKRERSLSTEIFWGKPEDAPQTQPV